MELPNITTPQLSVVDCITFVMEFDMEYEYRIIKHTESDEVFYCIEECMIDEDGVIQTHTIEYSPKCKSVEELKSNLEEMGKSFDKPILGSFPSVIKGDCCYD
jgi:hypothetical protein